MTHRNPHGGEVLRLAREMGASPDSLLDFSSNADSLVDHITARLVRASPVAHHHYPDDECTELCERIATHESVRPDNILAGNGSSELIFLALAALPIKSALMVSPVFSEYDRACRALDIHADHLALSPDNDFLFTAKDLADLEKQSAAADITIVCQPNNPTGALYDIGPVLAAVRSRYVLIDNTYREFLFGTDAYEKNFFSGYASMLRENTVPLSLCSFTKYFHCTGIRLGYVVSDPATVGVLKARKTPWTVWRLAETLGMAFLDHLEEYRAARKNFRALRSAVEHGLRQSKCFAQVFPANANFLTALLRDPGSSDALARHLLSRSLIVRQCDSIPLMPAGCIRMQIRTPDENERLLNALNDFAT